MDDLRRTEGNPHDRLTEVCDAMIQVLDREATPEEEIKCVIFLQGPDRGGMVLHGYDDDIEAVVDLFMHMRAIFRANGKELFFAPIQGVG